MSSIAIYMEGGGESKETKAPLRTGMSAFLAQLRDKARERGWNWKVVACGGRDQAYNAFRNAVRVEPRALNLLLVDSEAHVEAGVLDHLTKRDGWQFNATPEGVVHLMAQTMEAWILADRVAIRQFYGQNFQENALPNAVNLETVAKSELFTALARATGETQKGAYHMINHARKLLELIDSKEVRQRCPHCDRLFVTLDGLIP